MREVLFSLPGIALTIICWGAYGPVLHRGQGDLAGSRLKPLICVGVAYFVIAIVVPVVLLVLQGKLWDQWTSSGVSWSFMAGSAGAFGALGIVLALTAGGKPTYVMPLVFGSAPIVNVLVSMYLARIPLQAIDFRFVIGLLLVSLGAATVLIYQPRAPKPHAQAAKKPALHAAPADRVAQADEAT